MDNVIDDKSNEVDGLGCASRTVITVMVLLKLSYIYMVVTFFRLDWVEQETIQRTWKVEAMECEEYPNRAVILFYDSDQDADFPLYFSRGLHNFLEGQPSELISINREVVGRLPEWGYGLYFPKSIAGKKISSNWIVPQSEYDACNYTNNPEIIKKETNVRLRLR